MSVCVSIRMSLLCSINFVIYLKLQSHLTWNATAVLGPNNAPINMILKLSKIIKICLYVVIMPHVYTQDGFLGILTPETCYMCLFMAYI